MLTNAQYQCKRVKIVFSESFIKAIRHMAVAAVNGLWKILYSRLWHRIKCSGEKRSLKCLCSLLETCFPNSCIKFSFDGLCHV